MTALAGPTDFFGSSTVNWMCADWICARAGICTRSKRRPMICASLSVSEVGRSSTISKSEESRYISLSSTYSSTSSLPRRMRASTVVMPVSGSVTLATGASPRNGVEPSPQKSTTGSPGGTGFGVAPAGARVRVTSSDSVPSLTWVTTRRASSVTDRWV